MKKETVMTKRFLVFMSILLFFSFLLLLGCERSKEKGMGVNTVHLRGNAANEIIDASKQYDLIVMGTHGRSGLTHLLIGSVAEKVARHACCPVLLIREKPCE